MSPGKVDIMKTAIWEVKMMALIGSLMMAGILFGDGPVWLFLKLFEVACGRI